MDSFWLSLAIPGGLALMIGGSFVLYAVLHPRSVPRKKETNGYGWRTSLRRRGC